MSLLNPTDNKGVAPQIQMCYLISRTVLLR